MEKIIKDLWLTKVKKGKVAVVESPYAPNNHNCIWLKQGTMYVYGNSGWEKLSSSGGDTPEPEPVDPKYIVLPVEFNSFEQKTATIDNVPATVVISTAVSVQKEATEYPEEITTTAHMEGTEDLVFSSTPTLITEDSDPRDLLFFNEIQNSLSEIYPNDTVELVSITDYTQEGTSLLIADINGERKTLCFIYSGGPLANVSNVTVEQGEEEPSNNIIDIIEGPDIEMIPFVIAKEEYTDNDTQETYALIGYYADNIDGQIITRVYNGSYPDEFYAPMFHTDPINDNYSDYYGLYPLATSTIGKILNFQVSEETVISEILPPLTQQCICGFFSYNGNMNNIDGDIITTKSIVNPEKTLIIIPCFGNWQEIQGVGYTDTQIIANVFSMTEEEASEYTEHLRWIQHHHSA